MAKSKNSSFLDGLKNDLKRSFDTVDQEKQTMEQQNIDLSELLSKQENLTLESEEEKVEKTIINKKKIKDIKKEEAIRDMQNASVLLNEINNKDKSDKLNILANKIQAAKIEAERDKKSYASFYLKNSSKKKIEVIAKKLNISKSEALSVLIDNFDD